MEIKQFPENDARMELREGLGFYRSLGIEGIIEIQALDYVKGLKQDELDLGRGSRAFAGQVFGNVRLQTALSQREEPNGSIIVSPTPMEVKLVVNFAREHVALLLKSLIDGYAATEVGHDEPERLAA